MKIIICGAGKVGFSIASYLEKSSHDIIVIDHSPDLVKEISERYDIRAITGFAADPHVLQQAGAEDAQMLIAVTQSDEVNMITCEIANALFKIPMKIARIRNLAYLSEEWNSLFEEKNISVDVIISPEFEVAKSIYKGLEVSGTTSVTNMANDFVKIIGIKCTDKMPIVNTPLNYIESLFPDSHFKIAAIFRGHRLIIPDEKERLLAGDEVLFLTTEEELAESMRAFGHLDNQVRRILILGAGNIGLSLAHLIEKDPIQNTHVRIIEKSKDRAMDVARQLKTIEVLSGDGLDVDLLQDAGVEHTETIVAITDDDKVNILASLLAKQSGAKRAMSLISNPDTIQLVKSLGIDAVVNPREIAVSSILRFVRQGSVDSIYTLREGMGEIMEIRITEQSNMIGSFPHEIDRAHEIMLLAVVRDEHVLLSAPHLIFQLNDRLIVVAKRDSVQDVEKLFSARMDYF
ncbi:MAG: Trk system potassium transporter TrkA [Alphaproteobacteria bacterium]|nr:Trk system potassium transporter TrkA [Alphaproteobacteria bacterium]